MDNALVFLGGSSIFGAFGAFGFTFSPVQGSIFSSFTAAFSSAAAASFAATFSSVAAASFLAAFSALESNVAVFGLVALALISSLFASRAASLLAFSATFASSARSASLLNTLPYFFKEGSLDPIASAAPLNKFDPLLTAAPPILVPILAMLPIAGPPRAVIATSSPNPSHAFPALFNDSLYILCPAP